MPGYDAQAMGFRSSGEYQDWLDSQSRRDSTNSAAVDPDYFWRPIDKNTPVGVKMQLIRKSEGVATYGFHSSGNQWFTHWAPIPKFRD